jgi:predicted nucleic acid-binding protein
VRSRIVLDASAALHLVLDGKSSDAIAERLDEAPLVTAPDLFASEVANGLWRYVEHGDITAEEATDRLAMALALAGQPLVPGTVVAHEALVAAATYHHPVYDMMYAVLARRQGATVLTLDARLVRALRAMAVQAYFPGA